jgi:hypothetical protein
MRLHGLSLRPVAVIVGFNLAGDHCAHAVLSLLLLLLLLLLPDADAAAAMLCTYEMWHVLLYYRPPFSSIRERKFNKEDQYAAPGNLSRERLLTTAGVKPQPPAHNPQQQATQQMAVIRRLAAIQCIPVRDDVAVGAGARLVLARLLSAPSVGVRAPATAAGGRRHLLERATLLLVSLNASNATP